MFTLSKPMKILVPVLYLLAFIPAARAEPCAVLATIQLAQAEKKEISKSQAASIAQSSFGGKVLSVSREGNSYRVKLLQESGRVKIVRVDARTGRVSG